MNTTWQEVPLGEVLTERQETPKEQDLLTGDVRIISKIGFNEGKIQLREGTNTRTKMILIRPGDLVVSGINAAKGAIAIYGEENKEPVAATIHYGAYIPNKDKVEVKYLWWLLRSNTFKELLTRYVPGGIKTELKATRLLPVPIPLPPLLEQRQIVEKIEEIVKRTENAREIKEINKQKIDSLVDSKLRKIILEAKSENHWEFGPIPKYAEVNPSRKGQIELSSDTLVSFVPMSAVDDITGTIAEKYTKEYYQVSKGYTWFKEGGVIFARITPCMENGKSAIAIGLENGHGFGSTEFHVLKPSPKILAEWLHLLIRSKEFRKDAESHFKGTAGQQRVPQSFLEQKVIPVPSIPEQKELVNYFKKLMEYITKVRKTEEETDIGFKALFPSILDKAFKGEL